MDRHTVTPENAPKFLEWIAGRGGVAVWRSVNLSNPSAGWSTPALTEEGRPMPKPTWESAGEPERIITDAAEIDVVTSKEVRRFRIAVRRTGFAVKLTDASSRKVRAAVAKAGAQAWYEFDYSTQEAVIYVPDTVVPLNSWQVASV